MGDVRILRSFGCLPPHTLTPTYVCVVYDVLVLILLPPSFGWMMGIWCFLCLLLCPFLPHTTLCGVLVSCSSWFSVTLVVWTRHATVAAAPAAHHLPGLGWVFTRKTLFGSLLLRICSA